MKKAMILLLLAVTVSIQAQSYGEFAVYSVSLQLNAYEQSNEVIPEGNFRSHTLVVDDYYDIHLVKSKINQLVNKYSDVDYLQAWKWNAEGECFTAIIDFADLTVYIGYSDYNKSCIVLYDKIKGDKIDSNE